MYYTLFSYKLPLHFPLVVWLISTFHQITDTDSIAVDPSPLNEYCLSFSSSTTNTFNQAERGRKRERVCVTWFLHPSNEQGTSVFFIHFSCLSTLLSEPLLLSSSQTSLVVKLKERRKKESHSVISESKGPYRHSLSPVFRICRVS